MSRPWIWPAAQLPGLVAAVAGAAGLEPGLPPPSARGEAEARVQAIAAHCAIEAEPVSAGYEELPTALLRAAPAVLRLPTEDGAPEQWVGLVGCRRGRLLLIGHDGQTHRLALAALVAPLRAPADARAAATVEGLLDAAGLQGAPRQRTRAALVARALPYWRARELWLLRPDPGARLGLLLRHSRLGAPLAGFLGGHLAAYGLFLGSWWLLGRGVLGGRIDAGWLWAWALLLLTMVPLRMLTTWCQGLLAVRGGAVLKQRLMAGALRTDADALRHQGPGQLYGQAVEAEAVERLALSGAFAAVLALVELVVATGVLALGAGGAWMAPLLVVHSVLVVVLGLRALGARRRWTRARMALTHSLVERMVGHRTRLAQEAPDRWHDAEDLELARAHGASAELDRAETALVTVAARGWVVVGLAGLGAAVLGTTAATGELAVALGGVLLAQRSLLRLQDGARSLAGALVARDQIAPLFAAATQREAPGAAVVPRRPAPSAEPSAPAPRVLLAKGLRFAYPGSARPILSGVDLEVFAGDRLLLEGSSGGGKSTLAALLAGLRSPTGGLLSAGGLDRSVLGPAGWRTRVVVAPQFHENHVLTGTLAYNLLLGRRWPPRREDLHEAQALCGELGLGPLLERMPAGLDQVVGESGWQLSHGERGRVFLARALLQGAELVILDESFAALDPATLVRCMRVALDRAPTALVIAHP